MLFYNIIGILGLYSLVVRYFVEVIVELWLDFIVFLVLNRVIKKIVFLLDCENIKGDIKFNVGRIYYLKEILFIRLLFYLFFYDLEVEFFESKIKN